MNRYSYIQNLSYPAWYVPLTHLYVYQMVRQQWPVQCISNMNCPILLTPCDVITKCTQSIELYFRYLSVRSINVIYGCLLQPSIILYY
ncbi:hypothetical protein GDO81_008561 [Engystomops pustulosus]|uniref:Uncharacterized protein n=1 Tax=Engystomops pustulosus TaxID=76066 RepID=A0AAV7CHC2_ENGPU|nr:hypothetical protein GDO81_008561 [Engystomops pustulosus]